MTHHETVLAHLKKYGSITGVVAWRRYRIYRLADSIHKLRTKHRRLLKGKMIETVLADMEPRYATYYMNGKRK